jgi:hypothetical protein
MKTPTLQKVMLTTMAVVASLALNAQAGQPRLSTAKQTNGSTNKQEQRGPLAPTARGAGHFLPLATYQIDDGSAEDAVGFGDGSQNFESLWFNQFAVIPGNTTITSVEVGWGTPVFPDPNMDGTPVTIAVWSDPNGDGNPSDAALLGSVAGTIQNSGTNTFVTYTLTPAVTLPPGATSFFVGDLTPATPGGPQQFFQGIDQDSTLHRQSWVAAMSDGSSVDFNNPGNNDFIGIIDDFGLPGNWLIRANSGDATPTPTPTATPTPTPSGDALWYNGDFNDVNGLANERDTSLGSGQYASTYDDFNVPDADGWDVTSVFSNNLADTNVVGASWEIRQGITEGNGGTLIASGTTVTPNVTPTGRSGFGFTEFMVEVAGLSVHLDQGDYFLNVTPTGDLTGRSFDSTTSGANCVGTPCGDNMNAFFDSNFFGFVFTSTGNPAIGQPYDFSMGVNGTVSGGGGDLALTSAASVRRGFGIDLPLSGPSGVECRNGGPSRRLMVTMTFNNTIASVGSASSTCGNVTSTSISGNVLTVNLNRVVHTCNGHDVDVTANDVMDDMGNTLSSATATVGLLLGDANGDRVVDHADRAYVKTYKGQNIDSTNFRADVNNDGFVGSADVRLVTQQQGTSLP